MLVINEVRNELAGLCGVEPSMIKDDGLLVEYGMDSVRLLEMCCTIEDQYDIILEDEEIAPVRTVQDVADLIQSKVVKN